MPIDQYTLNYLHYLQSSIQSLNERLYEAEHRISDLQGELEEMKKNPKMHVGTIEYKFDQLKIETLEGTLNIGLSPNGQDNLLDDVSVGAQQIRVNKDPQSDNRGEMSPVENEVKNQIESYLHSNGLNDIRQIESQHNFPLNDQYRLFILEDIRKQIPTRIRQLSETLKQDPNSRDLEKKDSEQVVQLLFENLHRNILAGIDQFILKLKSGSEAE